MGVAGKSGPKKKGRKPNTEEEIIKKLKNEEISLRCREMDYDIRLKKLTRELLPRELDNAPEEVISKYLAETYVKAKVVSLNLMFNTLLDTSAQLLNRLSVAKFILNPANEKIIAEASRPEVLIFETYINDTGGIEKNITSTTKKILEMGTRLVASDASFVPKNLPADLPGVDQQEDLPDFGFDVSFEGECKEKENA